MLGLTGIPCFLYLSRSFDIPLYRRKIYILRYFIPFSLSLSRHNVVHSQLQPSCSIRQARFCGCFFVTHSVDLVAQHGSEF